ncbi:MAG: DUF3108 domain-containing protein [Gallionella sp.]|nr:DUF3108 domain-containing protein [Gallionella sp.]
MTARLRIPLTRLLHTDQPAARVVLAIVLSLLIHAVLLFGPVLIELEPAEIPLPPLVARLEPLPQAAPKPVPKPVPKPRPKLPAPASIQTEAAAEPTTAPVEALAQGVEEAPPAGEAPASEAIPATGKNTPPLPRHAQLTYIVYKGTDFAIGEARHRLEIDDDNGYTLRVDINTTGIASFFKTFEMTQRSSGTVSALGLRPDAFSEIRVTAKGNQAITAQFDWARRELAFSNGNHSMLPEQTQDILSFLYQFSQLPLNQPTLTLHISNGKKLESYELAIGGEEQLQTGIGRIRALPLHKIHAPGEEGLNIWLGLEYRLLPVKIQQMDKNGAIAGEMVISDIRVSDE